MLSHEDASTIKNAIFKRLGKEIGVHIFTIMVVPHEDHIAVGIGSVVEVAAYITDTLVLRHMFDLPCVFHFSHLLDEIDECAEQVKKARQDFLSRGGLDLVDQAKVLTWMESPGKTLPGTGLRGRWKKDEGKKGGTKIYKVLYGEIGEGDKRDKESRDTAICCGVASESGSGIK